MKIHILSLLALSGLPLAAGADYSIPWWTIAGGGGSSTNAQFSVAGTVGQPAAGERMTNGPLAVVGGFWASLQLVQTPGSPGLALAPATPGYVKITWSPTNSGFVLQASATLSTHSWSDVPGGTNSPVVVLASGPMRFFRLLKR